MSENISLVIDTNSQDNDIQKRDQKICNAFRQGSKVAELVQTFGLSKHGILNILHKYQLMSPSPKVLKVADAVADSYNQYYSIRKVADELGISTHYVYQALFAKGINTGARDDNGIQKNRKYLFNENYFSKISSEDQAYWLGFIYADGYVAERGVLVITLKASDKLHLEKFLHNIEGHIPLRFEKRVNAYSLNVCSIKVTNDLIRLGCVQKKSLVLTFPSEEQLPKQYRNHFMRGYFDGDGYVNVKSRIYNSVFQVLGTPAFLDVYESILLSHCHNQKPTKRIHQKSWNINTQAIAYSGVYRLQDIYRFLYDEATIYLDRKHDIFSQIITRPKSNVTEDFGV